MKSIHTNFMAWVAAAACGIVVQSCMIFEQPTVASGLGVSGLGDSGLTEYRSVAGVLSTTLTAQPTKVSMGGVTVDGKTYNGDYAGPVLRVKPGDVMRIKLVNHLAEPTNLHFHGLQTTPLGNADNVHISVPPGESFDYEVPIPTFQPPGLYWYHAHIHKLSESQVIGGLSGAIIVDGMAEQMPQLTNVPERLMVLKDYIFDDSDDPIVSDQWHDRIVTINGKTEQQIVMRPGQTELWHIGSHSANFMINLTLPGHTFRVVSEDGVFRTEEAETDVLQIKPAARMEVLVTSSLTPGTYSLQAKGILTGHGATYLKYRPLADVIVAGDPARPLDPLTDFPQKADLRAKTITARRTVIFSQNDQTHKFYMDNKLFDAERLDLRVPLGSIEEWTVKNETGDMHIFHIHQVHFQVAEINGVPQPFRSYADVVRVPEAGSVKIILPFTNPMIVGKFMYHCHVLNHEDRGMMAQIEVYDPQKLASLDDDIQKSICRALPTRPD